MRYSPRRTSKTVALAAATAFMAAGFTACNMGVPTPGDFLPDGEFAGNPQSLSPYRESLTPDEAYHLLRRVQFGATPEHVQHVAAVGLSPTVDDALSVKPTPDHIAALAKSFEDDIPRRWLTFLLEGTNPLHERLAMFWHDRFATSRRVLGGGDGNLAVQHMDMLRSHAMGNYRTMLEDLTLDPLMLIWLDGANSPKAKPNENYTREFWELFTLGRDVLYTEQDIREGARAFTGITLLREYQQDARPIFDVYNHDESNKHIFPARTAPSNHSYRTVIDLTLQQPEAGQYVARNLFKFFIHDHPNPETVQALADIFRNNNFDVAPVVRTLLVSQAMFSHEARGAQIATPVEHWLGVARTLDMHMESEDSQGYVLDRLADDLSLSGHELLNPPGVQGWDEDRGWLQDQWLLYRVRALGRTMEYGPFRTPDLPYHLLPPLERWSLREVRRELVDAVAAVVHLTLSEEEKDIYVEVLDQNGQRAFHLLDPEQQPQQVFEMIRLMAMDERVIGR